MFASQKKHDDAISLQRYEHKYLIHPELIDPIVSFIRPYCRMDPFAQEASDQYYPIKTLYLDSPDYRTYWDAREEVASRFKLRIRVYGDDDSGLVKFEIKRRFKDVCLKTTINLHGETWPELLVLPSCRHIENAQHSDNPALLGFIGLAHRIHAEPKMLILYERQAFQSNFDRYVRISFDRRICHQTKHSCDFNAQPANWIFNDGFDSSGEPGPHAVLELKVMTRAPIWLVDMVRRFGLVRRGFSKYCTAVTRMMTQEQMLRELFESKPAGGGIRRRQ
jgi:SPX domain protein involved in polyphosphate accumulation